MPFLILALMLIAAIIIAMFYIRRRMAAKGKGNGHQVDNYQCSLFDEEDKREACERLMKGGGDEDK